MMAVRTILFAALFAGLAPMAPASVVDGAAVAEDPARPAVGEWSGNVSWNSHLVVRYGWTISPDGSFTSGRLGRGENGGGMWSLHGTHLTLKYSDNFRYEGELRGNVYSGTAYTAEGRAYGGFFMSRDDKAPDVNDDDDH